MYSTFNCECPICNCWPSYLIKYSNRMDGSQVQTTQVVYCLGPTKSMWRLTWHLKTHVHLHVSPTINTSFIEPLYTTCSHIQRMTPSMCPFLSISLIQAPFKHMLVFLSLHIFLLERHSTLFCMSSLLSKTHLQVDVWSSVPRYFTSRMFHDAEKCYQMIEKVVLTLIVTSHFS